MVKRTILCGFLSAAIVVTTVAQTPAAVQQQQLQQQQEQQQQRVQIQQQVQQARVSFLRDHPRNDKSKASFNSSNQQGWVFVDSQCANPGSDTCAQAAIVEVTTECSASAKFFKKDTKVWQIVGFSMVLASATFTAIGASTTLANAKVFSTLGGTTGLGAVTANINANVSADQGGLVALSSATTAFLKFVQTGGQNNTAAPNELIYKSAPLYALQCTAAANASTGSSGK